MELTLPFPAVPESRALPRQFNYAHRVLILLLVLLQAGFCWTGRSVSLRGDVDFRAFYTAGVTLRTGHAHALYDYDAEVRTQQALFHGGRTLPFLYPAFAALPFVPLSLLSYRAAFLVFLLINLFLLAACAALLLKQFPGAAVSRGWLFVMFLAFFPTAIALMEGQVSCALLIIFSGFYLLTKHDRPWLAGLCLSLGLIKFQLVLPVVLLYLVWRQYEVVKGFLLGGVAVGSISFALAGRQGLLAYVARLHGVGANMLADPQKARQLYGMKTFAEPNLHGLMTQFFGAQSVGAGLTLVLSAAVLVWCAWGRPSLTTALPAAMLVSYHLMPYDVLLLVLPLTLLLLERPFQTNLWKQHRAAASLLLAGVVLLIAPVAPYLLLRERTSYFAFAVAAVLAAGRLLLRPNRATSALTVQKHCDLPDQHWFI